MTEKKSGFLKKNGRGEIFFGALFDRKSSTELYSVLDNDFDVFPENMTLSQSNIFGCIEVGHETCQMISDGDGCSHLQPLCKSNQVFGFILTEK